MQSIPFDKYKKILAILLLVAVFIGSNIFTYITANKRINYSPINTYYGYYVSFHSIIHTKLNFERFSPWVSDLKNDELTERINMNLRTLFVDWMPEKMKYPELVGLSTPYSNDKYLSLRISYAIIDKRTSYVQICNTIDMSTGEALYLDDIIEVDDELVSMILTEGNIKMDLDFYTGEHDVYYPQKILDMDTPAWVLERLQLCSEPFGENNWVSKPTFYLEKDRLYLLNVFNEDNSFYFELDTIRHKLKVDAW